MLQDIPPELRLRKQWINWRIAQSSTSKPTKIPVCSFNTAANASTADPSSWSDFLTALKTDKEHLGYVFSADDPYVGIDLDHVIENGSLLQGEDIVESLNSYTEISPSGTGLHIICRGKLPAGRRKKDWLEAYDFGRYFTVTGNVWKDKNTLVDCNGSLTEFYNKHLGSTEPKEKHESMMFGVFSLPPGSRHDEILHRLQMMRAGGMSVEDIMQLAEVIADRNGMTDRLGEIERMVRWVALNVHPEPKIKQVDAVESIYDIANLDSWPCQPVSWLIPGMIQRGSMILMAGESQTGKSMFASYLSNHIASGSDFLGVPCQKARVHYVCLEDKPGTIQARLMQFRQEVKPVDPGMFTMSFGGAFSLIGNLQNLEQAIINKGIELLVIDTYQRATPGANSFADEIHSKVYHSLSRITRKTGCSIFLIDHLRKSDGYVDYKHSTAPRKLTMDDIKGTGCKVQNADTVILMSRGQDRLRVDIRSKDLVSDNLIMLVVQTGTPKYRKLEDVEFEENLMTELAK